MPGTFPGAGFAKSTNASMRRLVMAQNALLTVIENIEDLSTHLQAQLLLLVEKPSGNQRLNGSRQAVRLITLAGTDLERACHEGRFRKDLYHRLSVLKITLPPLRDRRDDVPVLADFFASRYSIRNRGAIFRLPEEVRIILRNYDWPGNVSELKGSIKQSLAPGVTNWTENLSTWCRTQMGTHKHPPGTTTIDSERRCAPVSGKQPGSAPEKSQTALCHAGRKPDHESGLVHDPRKL